MPHKLRQKLGAALIDWPRYEWNLRGLALPRCEQGHWTRIANREDELHPAPWGNGFDRAGLWTSRLHACVVFPSLGRRLMRRSLSEWPVRFPPDTAPPVAGNPELTFVIGHRGLDRVPQLLATLASIAAQEEVQVECVVVEQSERADVGSLLPDWIRHVHTPLPDPDLPYVRSWALNVGARLARGRLLVFHDGDILVPARYAAELLELHGRGFEVLNLKRFVFYLSEDQTLNALRRKVIPRGGILDTVVQNLQAGGSVSVDRRSFFELGGFDEAFVGWGGEDDEFWDRAQTRRVWRWGYLPCVHLWHPPQPGKGRRDRATAALLEKRLKLSPESRIRKLASREFGLVTGLVAPPADEWGQP